MLQITRLVEATRVLYFCMTVCLGSYLMVKFVSDFDSQPKYFQLHISAKIYCILFFNEPVLTRDIW